MGECGKTILVTAGCDGTVGHIGECFVIGGTRDKAAERLARAIAEPQIAAARREGVIEGVAQERERWMLRDEVKQAIDAAVARERERQEDLLQAAEAYRAVINRVAAEMVDDDDDIPASDAWEEHRKLTLRLFDAIDRARSGAKGV